MFFILILAALLYVYRFFRKTGSAVASRFLEPAGASALAAPPAVRGTLLQRLRTMPGAERAALWEGGRRVTYKELAVLVQSVSSAAARDGVRCGSAVTLADDGGASQLAVAVANLAGVRFGSGGTRVTGRQLQQWLEAKDADKTEDEEEESEVERALDGILLGVRDSVWYGGVAGGETSRQVLRWQVGNGAAVGLLGSAGQSTGVASSEATIALLTEAEIESKVRDLQTAMEKGGWLQRWSLGQARAAAAQDTLPAWRRYLLATNLMIADTLFFSGPLSAVLGPRITHVLVSKADGPVEPTCAALLRAFSVELHIV